MSYFVPPCDSRIFQVVEIRLVLYFVAFGNQSNFHCLVFTARHYFIIK